MVLEGGTTGVEKIIFVSMCHLVVKFWTNIFTYLFLSKYFDLSIHQSFLLFLNYGNSGYRILQLSTSFKVLTYLVYEFQTLKYHTLCCSFLYYKSNPLSPKNMVILAFDS